MNIDSVLAGLATTLNTSITGVTCYSTPPDNLHPPCIVAVLAGIDYHDTFEDEMTAQLEAVVFAHRVDAQAGHSALHQYAELTGDKSVHAAIYADRTLGGTVDDCTVTKAQAPEVINVAGTDYLAMRFSLEAMG